MTCTPEAIDAVRRCAERGISARQAGEELGMTKNAVIGLANRNGVKFRTAPVYRPRKSAFAPKPKPRLPAAAIHIVTPRRVFAHKQPGPRCSWADCEHEAREGDMFCYPHSRMPLLGAAKACV